MLALYGEVQEDEQAASGLDWRSVELDRVVPCTWEDPLGQH